MQTQLKAFLIKGLSDMQLDLPGEQVDQLILHLMLLIKWNKKFNLTAITTPQEMITRHVMDSLSVSPYIRGERHLDVGTGGGFPGLPLSITHPQHQWVLLDSRNKKVAFLNHVIRHLGLNHHVKTLAGRVEDQSRGFFDTIIARAFSTLDELVGLCSALLVQDVRLIAMKGKYPDEELQKMKPSGLTQVRVEKLMIPQQQADRHIVIIDF